MIEHFQDRIRAAAAARAPLRIRGAGTKGLGGTGETLDTRGYAGIVAYEPTELYVTAKCGTPLPELEQALDAQGQMLAFEPPRFGAGGTVGGMIASGLSGPRRMQAGALRDFVLGVRLVDGRGDDLRFGGRVIKNVAGYDVSRLLAGSRGTLGLIAEVTLKVVPSPAAELSLRFALAQTGAITRMNQWAGRPLPISATAWHDGVLTLRLSGAPAALAAARSTLGGEPLVDVEAREFWESVRDRTHPFFAAPVRRIAVPSTTPPFADGDTFIEWNGALRWRRMNGAPADAVAPTPPALAALEQRVKDAFDPHGVFG